MKEYEIKINGYIFRRSDGAWIPTDTGNADYREYLNWLAEGNTPDIESGSP
jgi:hypothetical protein